jgi:hypothetical protein
MAEQSKMSLSTTFFVFSLQHFDFSTDQKNKIHFGFFIWSSTNFTCLQKMIFQNGDIIQYGVSKIFSILHQLLVSLFYAAFKLLFQNMIYLIDTDFRT